MKSAVIITVYKRYKYIDEALNSVLSQSVKPDQIIIVADNPKTLNKSINATVIEADYPQYGKMIFEAVNALRDDIDVVYFLDDDDMFHEDKIKYINKIFEKRRDIVTVHNARELVDENGNQLNLTYDIPFEVLVNRNNFRKISHQYPLGLGNNSSYSIRREFLEEIKKALAI
ncbi:MAG: glycosyltransferase [Sulfolobales archaeon]|nr:glycosyltransferase [Sulfolobales archaeon]